MREPLSWRRKANEGWEGGISKRCWRQLSRLAKKDERGDARDEIVILSAGTDGEDGPTDAAGAFADWGVIDEAKRLGLDAADFLRRNDAYHFFEPLGTLIKTGATHTNVCDVRVVLAERSG